MVRVRARGADGLSHFLLQLVGQQIDVAATEQVQHRSDSEKKILSPGDAIDVALSPVFESLGRQRTQMANHGDITKSARRLLDVGFELIDGVVELFVTFLDQAEQRFECRARVR
jgi:hypothetical protein